MAAILGGLVLAGACSKKTAAPAAPAAEAPASGAAAPEKSESPASGVTLNPEEIAKLGIATSVAAEIRFTPEKEGLAVVLGHDAVAQAVADIAGARAGVRKSQAVLKRMERLAGTAGAESAEALEGAAHQAAVDAAALALAQAKLSSIVGQRPPWAGHDDGRQLDDLAAGRIKLLRVTFPLGVMSGGTPRSLRVARLDAATVAERHVVHSIWDAPSDATLPGRSFFALLPSANANEGERLLAWAPGAEIAGGESGALVPASAAVASEGKYWVYLARPQGRYERAPLDISRPMADGYFVTDAIKPGDVVVSAAAGLLLARETKSGAEPD